MIKEIKFWLSKEWRVLVYHVLREGNRSVDQLAKLGASLEEKLVILEEPPHILILSLRDDHMGVIF